MTHEMYFVRNIKWLQDESAPSETWEYEVTTNAEVIGEMSYGPYYFSVWELGFGKREGDERRLCLRVEHRMTVGDDTPMIDPSREGFYHGGGVPDELIALSSLFLRRRLSLGPVVRMDNLPRMYDHRFSSRSWVDQSVIAGQSNLAELQEWFPLVEQLRSDLHQRFILASKLYQQSLAVIETNSEMSYLNLISAIEVLSGDHDIGEVTLEDRDKKLAELVDSVADVKLRQAIALQILKSERFIQRRFVMFTMDHIDDEFFTDPNRPTLGRVERENLPHLLKRIYQYRSNALHGGEPFPSFVLRAPIQGEEMPFGLNITQGERVWDSKDYIPLLHFFERLVRYVLLNYLKRNGTRH